MQSPIVGGVYFVETNSEEAEMATVKSMEKKARNVAERAFKMASKVVADSIDAKKPMDWIHHVMVKMQESFTKLENLNKVFLNSIDVDLDENKD